jgi:hypothetical protein
MNRVRDSAPPSPSLPDSILPFLKLIPGTPDNPNSATTDTTPHTYNTSIRQEYLGMLIRTRRRRRLRRTKSFRPTTQTQASTPGPKNTSDHAIVPTDWNPSFPSTDTSEDSTDLYYRAYANHRPEMGESNAESALREEKIKEDIKHMQDARKRRKKQEKQTKRREHTKANEETTMQTPTSPAITNNVQEITLQTDYHLYPNQDQCLKLQPLPFIYDTGAAISMISTEPSWVAIPIGDLVLPPQSAK